MDSKKDILNTEEENEEYVPPPQKTIEELIATDQDDESLRRYKETLLGNAQLERIIFGDYGLISIQKQNKYIHFRCF